MINNFIQYCILYILAKFAYELSLVYISRIMNSTIWKNIGQRYILITGATDGIGKEVALCLAKKKKKLIIMGRNIEKLTKTKEEILKYTECIVVEKDFSIEQNFDDLPDVEIGMLINNAGISVDHPMPFTQEPKLEQMIYVNNLNLVKLTKVIIIKMKEFSYVINISSGLGEIPSPLLSVYSGTKGFVNSWSNSLHFELKPLKIHVQSVVPMMVCTKMTKIRKPTLFCPSAKTFAESLVNTIGSHYIISPYVPHLIQRILLSAFPGTLIGILMNFFHTKIQNLAIKKKIKAQKN